VPEEINLPKGQIPGLFSKCQVRPPIAEGPVAHRAYLTVEKSPEDLPFAASLFLPARGAPANLLGQMHVFEKRQW